MNLLKHKREIYETVRKAEQAAVDLVRPGVKAMEIDKAARDVIDEAGYGEYFTHRLGHGLGISVHEFPSMTGQMNLLLKKVWSSQSNQVFIIRITGVRIEDDVVVTADGVEVLTKFPKELQIIQP